MVRTTQPTRDPYAMDIDKINLSPSERVEHIRNCKYFICHKEGCHLSKHKDILGKEEKENHKGTTSPGERLWRPPVKSSLTHRLLTS